MRRIGQVEVFTAVLLTGVFIASVSAVYFWGVPLIEKRQASTEINIADNLIRDIEAAILEVAQTEGTSQKAINLNLKGKLEASQEKNSITYVIDAKYPIYPSLGSLLNDFLPPDQVGVLGSNKPGVIVAKSERIDAQTYRTTYTLAYRELINPGTFEGIKIVINTPRNNIATAGTHTLSIFKKGVNVEKGESNLEGNLISNLIDVTIT